MKKLILICLVVPIAIGIPTSTLPAQVADSPGADFLHRSMPQLSPEQGGTHRGGDARPDTLPEKNGLVDHSGTQGQEGGGSSASKGDSANVAANVETPSETLSIEGDSTASKKTVFYLELPAELAADTLWLTYWEQFLEDNKELTPGTTIPLIGYRGDFFQGNMGYKAYAWSPDSTSKPIFFKIRNNRKWLFNTYTILQGDQIRVRKELSTGQTYFLGSSADFFRTQDLISSLAETQKLKAHPLMISNNPSRLISDSATNRSYQQASKLPEALYPAMVFEAPGLDDVSLVDSILAIPLSESDVIRMLAQIPPMDAEKQAWIAQRAWGEALSLSLSRLTLGKEYLKEPDYRRQYELWRSGIPVLPIGQSIEPLYLQANYELALLDAFVSGKSLAQAVESYPVSLKDHIVGRYLVNSFRRNEGGQASSLQTGLDLIKTPWIREKLLSIQAAFLPGAPFNPGSLTDLHDQPFQLQQFEGKSLLISFWISGCKFCMKYYQNTLKEVYEQFADREDLVFISVNADPNTDYWKNNLASGNYAHPDMVNLHQDAGTGLLKEYGISSFPQKLLIGDDFRIFLLTNTQYSTGQLSQLLETMTGKDAPHSVSKLN
ncbi:TlpA disulfide reductase family protein [Algoriphagus sp. NG3]|uniref:TlpA family protein disulfide reductase n=1 Tax=Algoriphagus sp. NG3 TaxID=3097546 RepID=UPI002A80DBA2|nr:TlpA disulfide reductase family protein [Algoriphagus sp. NG3]WPR76029.1 TlpA disulfide reductase family protein [Algoriphagus sp. NG3]